MLAAQTALFSDDHVTTLIKQWLTQRAHQKTSKSTYYEPHTCLGRKGKCWVERKQREYVVKKLEDAPYIDRLKNGAVKQS